MKPLLPVSPNLLRAFLMRVSVTDASECWVWTGTKNPKGYGVAHSQNGRDAITENVHRTSYRWFVDADLAASDDVHHVCQNKLCVNPKHLRALSRTDHAAEHRERRERMCPKGHVIDDRNVVYSKSRNSISRKCAICHRARSRASQRRLRAEREGAAHAEQRSA